MAPSTKPSYSKDDVLSVNILSTVGSTGKILDLGVVFDSQWIVTAVSKKSGQCFHQGIRERDVLIGINRKSLRELRISTESEFVAQMQLVPKPCTLEFVRGLQPTSPGKTKDYKENIYNAEYFDRYAAAADLAATVDPQLSPSKKEIQKIQREQKKALKKAKSTLNPGTVKKIEITSTQGSQLRSLGLGVRLSESMVVTKTFMDGQCYFQGVRKGDMCLGINGNTMDELGINSVAGFTRVLKETEKPCTLEFMEGKQSKDSIFACFSCPGETVAENCFPPESAGSTGSNQQVDSGLTMRSVMLMSTKLKADKALNLGVVLDETDWKVVKCIVTGQCYQQGIREGDFLKSINKKSLYDLDVFSLTDFVDKLQEIPKPCTLEFKVAAADVVSQQPMSRQPVPYRTQKQGTTKSVSKIRSVLDTCRVDKKNFIGEMGITGSTIGLNVVNSDGNSMLHVAAIQHNGEGMVSWLLAEGADVTQRNNRGDTAFVLAVRAGQSKSILAIVRHKELFAGSMKMKPLFEAVPGQKNAPLIVAASRGKYDCARELMQGLQKESLNQAEKEYFMAPPLIEAVKAEDPKMCRLLLETGAPFDAVLEHDDFTSAVERQEIDGGSDAVRLIKKFAYSIKAYLGIEPMNIGDALVEQECEYRVRSLQWFTRPQDGRAGRIGGKHSALLITVDCSLLGIGYRSFLLEKANTQVLATPFPNDTSLSNCANFDTHRFSTRDMQQAYNYKEGGSKMNREILKFHQLEGSDIRHGLTLANVFAHAFSLGPYNVTKSTCHHMCLEVCNFAAAKPALKLTRKDVLNMVYDGKTGKALEKFKEVLVMPADDDAE